MVYNLDSFGCLDDLLALHKVSIPGPSLATYFRTKLPNYMEIQSQFDGDIMER